MAWSMKGVSWADAAKSAMKNQAEEQMISDSITRCPRCGDEDTRLERTTYEGEPSYYIYCGNCGFEDDFGCEVNKNAAISLWNKKYDVEAPRGTSG